MTDEPKVQVTITPYCNGRLKSLRKKYRRVGQDIDTFVTRLREGETPGDQITGVGYTAYKARVANSDAQRGKSSGYRVIYYVQVADTIALITIYSKSEQSDISTDEIRQLIEDYLRSPSD